ncbi:FKBP-type peptidyl-prolyl cis-trans isomerase [Bacteroides sp.]
MNKKLYLLPLLLLALVLTSCEETKEASKFDNWRPRNEAFLDSLEQVYQDKTDPSLKFFVPLTDPNGKIFYKDITPEKTTLGVTPLYSDSVQVYYRGSYIFGDVFDQNYLGKDGPDPDFDEPLDCYVSPYVDRPSGWPITTVISGWGEVLQHMKVGQRWRVYLPQEYAYGTSGSGSIPGYSTLIFDMQLQAIME